MSEAATIDLAVLLPQPLSAAPSRLIPGQTFRELLAGQELPLQELFADDDPILPGISTAAAGPPLILARGANGTRPGPVLIPAHPMAGAVAAGVAGAATATAGTPETIETPETPAATAVEAKPSPHPQSAPATTAPAMLSGAAGALPSGLIPGSARPADPVRAAPPAGPAPEPSAAPTAAAVAIAPGKPAAAAGSDNPLEFQPPQVGALQSNPGAWRAAAATAAAPGPRLTAPAPTANVAGEGKVATVALPLEPATTAADQMPSVAVSRSSDPGMLHPGSQLAQQLGERLEWMVRTRARSAEIKVWPRDLGTVRINLSVDAEAVEIVIEASSPRMLDELHQAVPRLRSLMSEQGLGLTHLEIGQQRSQGDRHDASRDQVNPDNALADDPDRAPEESPELSPHRSDEPVQRLVDVFA